MFDTVKKFKEAGSLHTDQHNKSVIFPVVNSSFEAGQKMIKLEITHMMSQQKETKEVEIMARKKKEKVAFFILIIYIQLIIYFVF